VVNDDNEEENTCPYEWGKEEPDESDSNNFILFKLSNRYKKVNEITAAVLQEWKTKEEVIVCVYVYRLQVDSAQAFALIKKSLIDPLISDRAGAETTAAVNVIL
jgi:hypothetical protein